MHEFGITARIVDAVMGAAQENGGNKVLKVDLRIGKLTFLNLEQVRYAYVLLVKGTLLVDSELDIEEVEGVIKCINCLEQKEVHFKGECMEPLPLFSCSNCGGKVEIIAGKECLVKGIVVET